MKLQNKINFFLETVLEGKFSFFLLLILLLSMFSCGHRKNPTGGKKDTIKPEIISISPEEFSNISDKNIEIVFSKPIKRNSILTGLYIYPSIDQKKYIWDKSVLKIEIYEQLRKNTNYFFSFTDKIEGEHGNLLKENYLFVYANGNLNERRIAGKISYEKSEDKSKSVQLKLMTADSTKIYARNIDDRSFVLENLNEEEHIIEMFIDKNQNRIYDIEKEPYYFHDIPKEEMQTLNVHLAYVDTLRPKIESIKVKSESQLSVILSETIKNFGNLTIKTADSLESPKLIKGFTHRNDIISLVVEPLDTLMYQLKIVGLEDEKHNIGDQTVNFSGTTLQDTIPPEIVYTSIRNGETINTRKPKIILRFSEFIFLEDVELSLLEIETKKNIDFHLSKDTKGDFQCVPKKKLENLLSYRLLVKIIDVNELHSARLELQFIPIIHEGFK